EVLRNLTTLPKVQVVRVGTAMILPYMRAYHAEEALISNRAGGHLKIALLLSAAELYDVGQLNEALDLAYEVVSSSWSELMQLSEDCWAAILKHNVPEVELCRIHGLLGKARDLAEDLRRKASSYNAVKSSIEPANKRANDILAVVKTGCAQENESVLQCLRDSTKRAGRNIPNGPASSGDDQADWTT
ncbi:hypothetical protein LTR35_018246, partial [Friedmanniomyces endolithicus]